MTFLEQAMISPDERKAMSDALADILVGLSDRDREMFERGWMLRASHHLASNNLKKIGETTLRKLDRLQDNWASRDLEDLLEWWPVRFFKKEIREDLKRRIDAMGDRR